METVLAQDFDCTWHSYHILGVEAPSARFLMHLAFPIEIPRVEEFQVSLTAINLSQNEGVWSDSYTTSILLGEL